MTQNRVIPNRRKLQPTTMATSVAWTWFAYEKSDMDQRTADGGALACFLAECQCFSRTVSQQ